MTLMQSIRPALVLIAVFTLLTGVALPLGFVSLAGVVSPGSANGSLVERQGQVVGSALIGQSFTSDRYFRGRPSATTGADPADATKQVPTPYNAAASLASNNGASNKALSERVMADIGGAGPVPGDAVTTSASGLDPHVSPATALRQVARVATARGVAEDRLRALVTENTEGRLLGLIGEPRVNVLHLNLALDSLAATR